MGTGNNTDLIANRPVWASSSLEHHINSHSNDGDGKTYWRPAQDDIHPSLIFDMENFYTLGRILLNLGNQRVHIRVSVSKDKQNWKTVYSNRFIRKAFSDKTLKLKKSNGRYLKIEFSTADVQVITVKAFNES